MSRGLISLFFIFLVLTLFSSSLSSTDIKNLSFEEAISVAIKNNPQIKSLREQIAIYEEREKESFSNFLPQLNASVLYKRTTANSPAQVGLKIPSSLSSMTSSLTGKRESMDSYNNYSVGLTLNQLVWDFGKTSGMYESTKYLKMSANEDLRGNLDNLVVNLYQTVLNYALNKELLEAALLYEKQMESHLEMARAQAAAGVRTNVDVLRAESDFYNAKLNTLKIRNNLKIFKINLKNLLAIDNDSDIEISLPKKEEYYEVSVGDNYEYIQKRPEYLSYKNKIESLKSNLKSARSGYFPNIYLSGGLSYTGYDVDNMVYNWNVGASMSWNLFSGFYTTAYESEIRAQIRMYESILNQTIRNLYVEIENAKIRYEEAKERLNLNRLLMRSAEETLNLAEARYKSGVGTFIEVSDAQNIFVNSKNSFIQAEYDLMLSVINLKKALGILGYVKEGD